MKLKPLASKGQQTGNLMKSEDITGNLKYIRFERETFIRERDDEKILFCRIYSWNIKRKKTEMAHDSSLKVNYNFAALGRGARLRICR